MYRFVLWDVGFDKAECNLQVTNEFNKIIIFRLGINSWNAAINQTFTLSTLGVAYKSQSLLGVFTF